MTTPDESKPTYTQEDMDRATSYKSGMTQQLADLRKQNEDFAAQLKERDDLAEKARAEKLEQDGQLKELNEQLTQKMAEMESGYKGQISELESNLKNINVVSAIKEAGITRELEVIGLQAKYNSTEDAPPIGEWLASVKEAEPNLFAQTSENLGNKGAGTPPPGGAKLNDQLAEEYAKSDDPAKQEQAEDYWEQKFLAR